MATDSSGFTASTSADSARSIGELFAQAQQELTLLIRQEVELAKAEMRDDARRAGIGVGLLVVMGVLLMLASLMLSVAAALGIAAAGLHPAVGFVIVGGAYLILGAILGAVGARRLQRIRGPERAIQEAKESKALLDHLKA